ncbi:SRPBCC family protein [Edaphobacter bradus]|uniref:SRPBCC family protein n=1 Tax=Edaphobacter bradus TaxID=2259016 RepID=UPI0021DF81B0|nr:SRPBCC domain-containing protein [Edaphobacter bradus]
MATSVVEMQAKSESKENLKLEVKRVIKASRQRVFDAWTRPETIRLWFAPGTSRVTDASLDAREGGAWRLAMTGGCGEEGLPDTNRVHAVTGRYTRVEPYDVLAFTWKSPANPDEESLVTIELKDVEDGTELTLTHERFLTVESRDRHLAGWSIVVPKLQEFFEKV